MKSEMMKKLEQVAFERTKPFCYGCYRQAPTGVCLSCGSDDLMRELPGVGVEYGLNWVIEHILREELTPFDIDAEFESSMEGCYADETQIGFIKVNTLWAIQQLDPTAWDMAKQEWVDSEEQEERIMTFDNGSTYYVELTRKTYKRMEEKLKEYIDSPHLGTLLYICKTDGIVTAISKTAKKFDELNGRFNAMTVTEFFSKNADDFIHSIMQGKVC